MNSKPWYLSKTILGALVVVLGTTLRLAGYQLDTQGLTDDILVLLGAALAIYGRFRAVQQVVWSSGEENPPQAPIT